MTDDYTNMNPLPCKRLYSAEDWIDWLLGNKTVEQNAAMHEHLKRCPACADTVAEWAPLLRQKEGGRMAPAMPSEAVGRRLRRHVRLRGLRSQAAAGLKRHRRKVYAGAAALFAAICLVGLYGTMDAQQERLPPGGYVAVHEPGAVPLVNDPETASYKVQAASEELGEGYVWFNDSSGEMLVVLDGVFPSEGYDIQAWAVDGSVHTNLGLLQQLETSRAHLYVKAATLADIDNVALTVEPSGGSAAPTSPDALLFRLVHHLKGLNE